jgi:hypothetical protein
MMGGPTLSAVSTISCRRRRLGAALGIQTQHAAAGLVRVPLPPELRCNTSPRSMQADPAATHLRKARVDARAACLGDAAHLPHGGHLCMHNHYCRTPHHLHCQGAHRYAVRAPSHGRCWRWVMRTQRQLGLTAICSAAVEHGSSSAVRSATQRLRTCGGAAAAPDLLVPRTIACTSRCKCILAPNCGCSLQTALAGTLQVRQGVPGTQPPLSCSMHRLPAPQPRPLASPSSAPPTPPTCATVVMTGTRAASNGSKLLTSSSSSSSASSPSLSPPPLQVTRG